MKTIDIIVGLLAFILVCYVFYKAYFKTKNMMNGKSDGCSSCSGCSGSCAEKTK